MLLVSSLSLLNGNIRLQISTAIVTPYANLVTYLLTPWICPMQHSHDIGLCDCYQNAMCYVFVQETLDVATENWGIMVERVEM